MKYKEILKFIGFLLMNFPLYQLFLKVFEGYWISSIYIIMFLIGLSLFVNTKIDKEDW